MTRVPQPASYLCRRSPSYRVCHMSASRLTTALQVCQERAAFSAGRFFRALTTCSWSLTLRQHHCTIWKYMACSEKQYHVEYRNKVRRTKAALRLFCDMTCTTATTAWSGTIMLTQSQTRVTFDFRNLQYIILYYLR